MTSPRGNRLRHISLALAFAIFAGIAAGLVAPARSAAAVPQGGVTNIAPQPSFWDACVADGYNSQPCVSLEVQAIDNARTTEGRKALVLPNNFLALTPAEQTFVVIDLERVDRGLQPLAGLVPGLNAAAQPAASREVDPTPTQSQLGALGVHRYRTLWASSRGPLASDYEWMYDDGYSAGGSSNVDCQSPGADGCWAHRQAILATFAGDRQLLAGAGSVSNAQGYESITAILTGGNGAHPKFVYTWRQALSHGADA